MFQWGRPGQWVAFATDQGPRVGIWTRVEIKVNGVVHGHAWQIHLVDGAGDTVLVLPAATQELGGPLVVPLDVQQRIRKAGFAEIPQARRPGEKAAAALGYV